LTEEIVKLIFQTGAGGSIALGQETEGDTSECRGDIEMKKRTGKFTSKTIEEKSFHNET